MTITEGIVKKTREAKTNKHGLYLCRILCYETFRALIPSRFKTRTQIYINVLDGKWSLFSAAENFLPGPVRTSSVFFRQRLNLPEFGPLPATCGNVLPLTLSLPFSHSPLSRLISSTLCNALVLHWTSIHFETKLELEFDQPASNSHPGSALSGIFSFPRISRSVPVAKIGERSGKNQTRNRVSWVKRVKWFVEQLN